MNQRENNYAFIDSQNLNLSIRNQGWVLNFGRFRKYLQDKYRVSKVFLFIGYVTGNEALYTSLQRQGYIVIFKPTLYLPDGKVKGNVDAELVLHAMIEYPNYDKAVIVSGDGDFHCLIEYLQKQGKLLKLIVPDWDNYSSLLRKFIPNIAFMNTLKEKLKYEKTP
ncbi:MAG: NYN domain-containing protein [Minisyncoccales bacterium]